MKNRQLKHAEVVNPTTKYPIIVVLENIESPENVGMIFRISEAMGISQIYLTGSSLRLPNRKAEKVSRSTIRNIAYTHCESTTELILKLSSEGYKIYAIEVTESAKLLHTVSFDSSVKYAFIVGSEKHGITHETLNKVNNCVAIEMYGNNTSINVVTALSITLYEVTRQFRLNV